MGYKPHRICCSHPDQISLKGALGTNIERKKNNKKVIIVKIKAIKTTLLTNSSGFDRFFSLFFVNLTFNNPFMLIPLEVTIYNTPPTMMTGNITRESSRARSANIKKPQHEIIFHVAGLPRYNNNDKRDSIVKNPVKT
jgi:hypothetical protein